MSVHTMEGDIHSQLGLTNLVGSIFYSISGGGRNKCVCVCVKVFRIAKIAQISNSYKSLLRLVCDLQILRHEGEARVPWVCESQYILIFSSLITNSFICSSLRSFSHYFLVVAMNYIDFSPYYIFVWEYRRLYQIYSTRRQAQSLR